MNLVWARPASADRNEIRKYIAQDNPAAALTLDALPVLRRFLEQAGSYTEKHYIPGLL